MTVRKGCLTKERKELILKRLNRISGQVNGLKKMIENDRYCLDILQQVSSVHEALRGSGKVLMRNYLEVCATKAIRSKKGEKQDPLFTDRIARFF